MKPIISVSELCKDYRVSRRKPGFVNALKSFFVRNYETKHAVRNVNFDIMPGERVGFVGPNGAGKSTTVKMLTGILKPTSGVVKVLGYEPFSQRSRIVKNFGVIFGQRGNLWWDIPAIDTYYLFKEMYDVPIDVFEKRLRFVRNRLGIRKYLEQPVRKLSLGERMRCELGLILMHNPKILFLDEPTIGVDVVGKKRIRDFFREINRKYNTTVLLTSHDMVDVEHICKRVIIIDHGSIIYDGKVSDFKKRFMTSRIVELRFKKDVSLKSLCGRSVLCCKGKYCRIVIDKDDNLGRFLGKVLASHEVVDVKIIESDISDLIRKIFEKGVK